MAIVRRTRAEIDRAKFDWRTADATTEAAIAAQIAADPDTAPVFSAAELARAARVVPAPAPDDVKAIRQRLGLSQSQFAKRYGFGVDVIRQYEQGRRRPTGAIRAYLRVIARDPDAVTRALARD